MAMTYTVLTGAKSVAGSIANWVNSSAADASTILDEAQDWIYERLRVPDMLNVDPAVSLALAAETLTVTTDYIATKVMIFTGTDMAEIRRADAKDVELSYTYDGNGARVPGKPKMFYRIGTTLQLDVPADKAYTIRHLYFKRPAYLSGSVLTNFLTDRCKKLVRSACMLNANEFLKDDEEKSYWLQIAMNEIETLNIASDFESLDADLVVTPQ